LGGALVLALQVACGALSGSTGRALAAEAGTAPGSKGRDASLALRWVHEGESEGGDPKQLAVEVTGFSPTTLESLRQTDYGPDWSRLLSVYTEHGNLLSDLEMPPMAGTYRVFNQAVRFTPRFPLEPGVRYRAIFRPAHLPGDFEAFEPGSHELLTAVYQIPRPTANPTTAVRQVYPSADRLPENLLKFYIHFSAPMSRGRIYEHIHLLGETGEEIEHPFLELDEELWDPAMQRLTLFIDPGRIKRGVRPLEEVGSALESENSFTLVIDETWQDATGTPLKESFRKHFRVGPPDRRPPDPAHWEIQSPRSGTREALTIGFPEPMDHALARRLIDVIDQTGKPLRGRVKLQDHERRWVFVPAEPWQRGPYGIQVQTILEDLAGNNIGKPFEVDRFDDVQRRLTNEAVRLQFEVR
jgi:hypothetical protein